MRRPALDTIRKELYVRRMRRQIRPARFGAFGEGTVIDPPLTVTCPDRVFLGRDIHILRNAWFALADRRGDQVFDPKLTIGDRTYIGRDLTIACLGEVSIGADGMLSDRLLIGDTYHDYRDPDVPIALQPMADPRPVVIEDGVFIGLGAMVLAGVTVGRNSLIGAGSVVTSSVPPNSVVVGNPARIVRHYDRERGEWMSGAPASA